MGTLINMRLAAPVLTPEEDHKARELFSELAKMSVDEVKEKYKSLPRAERRKLLSIHKKLINGNKHS